jgi:hypothetical protein
MDMLLGLAVMLCLPAWAVMQLRALFTWQGLALWLSLVPFALMGPAFLAFLIGMTEESNLAPIFMILAAPPCLLWLLIVGYRRRA